MNKPFGDKLRKARLKAGLTQAEAAVLFKVSKRTVEHWENNERLPAMEKDAITRERLLASLKKASMCVVSNIP